MLPLKNNPSVAGNTAGVLVVAWQHLESATNNNPASFPQGPIFVQRYAAPGTSSGEVINIGEPSISAPSVAVDGSGNFVVIWQRPGPSATKQVITGGTSWVSVMTWPVCLRAAGSSLLWQPLSSPAVRRSP